MLLTLNDRTFSLSPNIGHCIELQARDIDLLGSAGDAQLVKLVSDPVAFLTILEVLIGDQAGSDSTYKMPALASLMSGQVWTETRKAVVGSFRNFFRESGYPQLAGGLDRFSDATDEVTRQVAASLETGELREKIEAAVQESIRGLTSSD